MKFEMETLREIWNNMDKTSIEIGPDRDGLNCVEIRYKDENHEIRERISFPPEQARLVAIALTKCADELELQSK